MFNSKLEDFDTDTNTYKSYIMHNNCTIIINTILHVCTKNSVRTSSVFIILYYHNFNSLIGCYRFSCYRFRIGKRFGCAVQVLYRDVIYNLFYKLIRGVF